MNQVWNNSNNNSDWQSTGAPSNQHSNNCVHVTEFVGFFYHFLFPTILSRLKTFLFVCLRICLPVSLTIRLFLKLLTPSNLPRKNEVLCPTFAWKTNYPSTIVFIAHVVNGYPLHICLFHVLRLKSPFDKQFRRKMARKWRVFIDMFFYFLRSKL